MKPNIKLYICIKLLLYRTCRLPLLLQSNRAGLQIPRKIIGHIRAFNDFRPRTYYTERFINHKALSLPIFARIINLKLIDSTFDFLEFSNKLKDHNLFRIVDICCTPLSC